MNPLSAPRSLELVGEGGLVSVPGGVGESSSLEQAITAGALLFRNMLLFLIFLLSCAFSTIFIVFLGL